MPLEAQNSKASRLSQRRDDNSFSYEEDREGSDTEYESNSSSAEEEDSLHGHKKQAQKRELTKETEEVNWWFEKLGPKHPGLNENRPSNSLYKKFSSPLPYRLRKATHERTLRKTGKVRDFKKITKIPLRRSHFNGEAPIRVLYFLARFTRESNIQETSKAQAYVTLPLFFERLVLSLYVAMAGITPSAGRGITCWSETVQYLLASYTQTEYITNEIINVLHTKQKPQEDEK